MELSIVLASSSPRRREILQMLGVRGLRVVSPSGEEEIFAGSPERTVMELSAAKAREVARTVSPGEIVIGADTIVFFEGQILGKPRDYDEADRMIERLSGCSHMVYSGITLIQDGEEITEVEETMVYFREISYDERRAYLATGEPFDKAGAYGAQGAGSIFIERIEGDFFNVMGLPVCTLGKMLKKLGRNLI